MGHAIMLTKCARHLTGSLSKAALTTGRPGQGKVDMLELALRCSTR